MNSGNRPMFDAKGLVNHLNGRRNTVCCATGCSNDWELFSRKQCLVHAHHNIKHLRYFDRCRDHHLRNACIEIRRQRINRFKLTRTLKHQITITKISILKRFCRSDPNLLMTDHEIMPIDCNGDIPIPMNRIKCQQMCMGSSITSHIIHMNQFSVGWFCKARIANRPIRPSPLIPIRIDHFLLNAR